MKGLTLALGAALAVAGCALTPGVRDRSAVVGGAAGAIRGSQQDRANQQRYRDSSGRYYYCYDGRQTECYWEDGRRR